ncbi:transposase (plasmid) [Microvirga sp. RSM25]|uniref:transposase n=1 Tax=Microvirga sp. RSM25 TaxID=3273802 RepID=UPI00384DFC25
MALTLRAVLRLALRQTDGLIGSILHLCGPNLVVPDRSTLNPRAETLDVPRPSHHVGPVHLRVDCCGACLLEIPDFGGA